MRPLPSSAPLTRCRQCHAETFADRLNITEAGVEDLCVDCARANNWKVLRNMSADERFALMCGKNPPSTTEQNDNC